METRLNANSFVNRLRTAGGFSLLEVLVALAISAVVLAVVAGVIQNMWAVVYNQADKIEADRLLQEAAYYITKAMTRGVNITYSGAANLNSYSSGTSAGQIVQFDGSSIAGGSAGQTFAVAVFNREDAPSSAGQLDSQINPTAIYYQMPTPNTSGAIYVDFGENKPTLYPTASNFIADRITNFRITNVQTTNNDGTIFGMVGSPTLSVQFEISVRYFLGQNVIQAGGWCPLADQKAGVSGCKSLPSHDIDINFQVPVLNNTFPSAGTTLANQSVQGRIYYFRMLNPLSLGM